MVNENLLDVLIYIYENYLDDDETNPRDQILLAEELLNVGFNKTEIDQAFDWLDELARRQGSLSGCTAGASESTRIYGADEQAHLDLEIQGLLHYLVQIGILDPISRELVIERAMALSSQELEANDVKWIVLLVLLNQPGRENAIALMEDLVYDNPPQRLH